MGYDYSKLFIDPNGTEHEPDWDEKLQKRQKGLTTFNICGWCKHNQQEVVRYNCVLEGSCSLTPCLRDQSLGKRVYWNTPCIMRKLGKEDLVTMKEAKQWLVNMLEEDIVSVKEEVEQLHILETKAENKPPIAEFRQNYFAEEDKVYLFYEDYGWEEGSVVLVQDSLISFHLRNVTESHEPPIGTGPWCCGFHSPTILKEWEYLYFVNHPEEFATWLNMQNRSYGNEILPIGFMKEALGKEEWHKHVSRIYSKN